MNIYVMGDNRKLELLKILADRSCLSKLNANLSMLILRDDLHLYSYDRVKEETAENVLFSRRLPLNTEMIFLKTQVTKSSILTGDNKMPEIPLTYGDSVFIVCEKLSNDVAKMAERYPLADIVIYKTTYAAAATDITTDDDVIKDINQYFDDRRIFTLQKDEFPSFIGCEYDYTFISSNTPANRCKKIIDEFENTYYNNICMSVKVSGEIEENIGMPEFLELGVDIVDINEVRNALYAYTFVYSIVSEMFDSFAVLLFGSELKKEFFNGFYEDFISFYKADIDKKIKINIIRTANDNNDLYQKNRTAIKQLKENIKKYFFSGSNCDFLVLLKIFTLKYLNKFIEVVG